MSRRLLVGAVLGAASQLSGVGLLLTSAWLIVRAAEHPPVMYLMVAIVSVRFFGVGRAVFRYGERLQTHHVALTRMIDDRVQAYRNLERAAPAGLPRQRRGDIISRVVSDVTVVQDALLRIRLPWAYTLTSSTVVVGILVWLSPAAASVTAGHVLLCLAVARIGVARAVRPDARDAADARGAMSAESAALASTSRDLVAHGAADSFTRRVHAAIDTQARAQGRAGRVAGAGGALVVLSTGVATLLVALTVGPVTPVMAGVVLLAPLALMEPLLSIVEAERLRPSVLAARSRLAQLDGLRSPVDEPTSPALPPAGTELVLHDVVAGWTGDLTRPVTVTLRPGHVVGLSGPSGVGKSTLALTMARLVAPRSGRITMDGTDLVDLAGDDVRARVGLCGQDDILFATTIRENLRVAAPLADDSTMTGALCRVGLGPLLDRMPAGLDTQVGTLGSSLSGGERQRLAMARLLLADHHVLVFDEPTEHLDHEAAQLVLADILALSHDHAIVLISHSADVLAACDDVVVIESPERRGSEPTAEPALSRA